jgi:hypothetical protein
MLLLHSVIEGSGSRVIEVVMIVRSSIVIISIVKRHHCSTERVVVSHQRILPSSVVINVICSRTTLNACTIHVSHDTMLRLCAITTVGYRSTDLRLGVIGSTF